MNEKKPIEIARESLMRLNARKLAPTPANYQAVYNEIAGVPDLEPFPQGALRKIARALPARSAAHARQKQGLDQAIQQCDWQRVQDTLVAYANAAPDLAERSGARSGAETGSELLGAVARLIENALPALGADDEKFCALADLVVKTLRDVRADPTQIKPLLANFSYRLSFAAEDQAEVRAALMRLLQRQLREPENGLAGAIREKTGTKGQPATAKGPPTSTPGSPTTPPGSTPPGATKGLPGATKGLPGAPKEIGRAHV